MRTESPLSLFVRTNLQTSQHISLGIRKRLALFQNDALSDIIHMLPDQRLIPQQNTLTRDHGRAGPVGKGIGGGVDGGGELGGCGLRDFGEDTLGGLIWGISDKEGRRERDSGKEIKRRIEPHLGFSTTVIPMRRGRGEMMLPPIRLIPLRSVRLMSYSRACAISWSSPEPV